MPYGQNRYKYNFKQFLIFKYLKSVSVMRKATLIFLFIGLSFMAYNQVMKETVSDQKTHEEIFSTEANFNDTTVGTLTDKNGNIELVHSENAPAEIAYIQTSKDIYETGEDLWLKVYLLDSKYLMPSLLSKTLYLQLLNSNQCRLVKKSSERLDFIDIL